MLDKMCTYSKLLYDITGISQKCHPISLFSFFSKCWSDFWSSACSSLWVWLKVIFGLLTIDKHLGSFEWLFERETNTFQCFAYSDGCLKDAASSAYAKTCAPYHTWAVRTAAYAGMYALPTRDQLLLKLNETGKLLLLSTVNSWLSGGELR